MMVGAAGLVTSMVRSPLPDSQATPLPTNRPTSEEATSTCTCPRTAAAPSLAMSTTENVSLPLTKAYRCVPSRAKPVSEPKPGSVSVWITSPEATSTTLSVGPDTAYARPLATSTSDAGTLTVRTNFGDLSLETSTSCNDDPVATAATWRLPSTPTPVALPGRSSWPKRIGFL